MSILTFIKGLTHKLGKNEIAKSCELSLEELRDNTLPAYESALDLFKTFKMSSPEAKNFQQDLTRSVKGAGNNMIEIIETAMRNAEGWLVGISKKSDTLFADQEATMALTYQKANYLRAVAAIGFAVEYARRFLNYLYVLETAKSEGSDEALSQQTPAQVEYINKHFQDFIVVVRFLQKKFDAAAAEVDAAPDAIVSSLTEQTLSGTIGASRLDPLGMNNLTAHANPFYLIGVMVASYQVARYKSSKEELDLLQMRKLYLEKLQQKKPDAALAAQIEKLQERISNKQYELEKLEEKYGIH